MNDLLRTATFDHYLRTLRDPIGKARILARLRAAQLGHFGDCESVGDGIREMRVHYGPGYRIYFCRRGEAKYLLLCAGDKNSQARDIRQAKQLLAELEGKP